jgi:hypothetical protein
MSSRPQLPGGAILYRMALRSIVVQKIMGPTPDLKCLEGNIDKIQHQEDSHGLSSMIAPSSMMTRSESDTSEEGSRCKRARTTTTDSDSEECQFKPANPDIANRPCKRAIR